MLRKRRNSGPPDQSLPVVEPGKGVMGLAVDRSANGAGAGCRIRLLVDPRLGEPNEAGIPFLGIGAQSDRGNGVPISVLHPSRAALKRRVAFSLKLDTVHVADIPGNAVSIWFYAFALWDGKPRMAMVSLYELLQLLEHVADFDANSIGDRTVFRNAPTDFPGTVGTEHAFGRFVQQAAGRRQRRRKRGVTSLSSATRRPR